MKVAIVVSRFNHDVTARLLEGAQERLTELGLQAADVTVTWVPGAVELPLLAQRFAREGSYQAVICLGAVIEGETDHYQYVCQQVSDGCQRVALDHHLPVIFGVLTTKTKALALARVTDPDNHKGREAAEAALDMMALMSE